MKINLKAFSIVILHGRIFRPYYLDPETGDLFSSRCLDAKTLKFCNASDLNPKTGTVRTALCLRPHSGKNMIAVFGESTLKISAMKIQMKESIASHIAILLAYSLHRCC